METQLGPLPRGASRVRGQPRPPHTPAACSSDRATPWTPHRLLTTSPRIVAFTPRRRAPESTSHAPAPREAPDQRSGARARQAPRPGDAGSSRRLPEPAAPAPRTSACCVRAAFPAPRCRTPLLPRPSKSAHLFCFGGLELNPNYPSRPLPPLRLRGRQLPATPAPWSPGPSPRALLPARAALWHRPHLRDGSRSLDAGAGLKLHLFSLPERTVRGDEACSEVSCVWNLTAMPSKVYFEVA